MVEGNHYFPAGSLRLDFSTRSDKKATCHWKGEASYYDVTVNGKLNQDAAWYYPSPKTEDRRNHRRVAFWQGVQVVE